MQQLTHVAMPAIDAYTCVYSSYEVRVVAGWKCFVAMRKKQQSNESNRINRRACPLAARLAASSALSPAGFVACDFSEREGAGFLFVEWREFEE